MSEQKNYQIGNSVHLFFFSSFLWNPLYEQDHLPPIIPASHSELLRMVWYLTC